MQNQPKISLAEIYFLVIFALIADLINWIPIVNWIVTLITLPSFYFYFRIIKRIPAYPALAGNLIEFIPVISMLPAITLGVIANILLDRSLARLPREAQSIAEKGRGKPSSS